MIENLSLGLLMTHFLCTFLHQILKHSISSLYLNLARADPTEPLLGVRPGVGPEGNRLEYLSSADTSSLDTESELGRTHPSLYWV